jgi:hypothetical protein
MYLRTIQRRNKDGSVVRYVQLAHNERHPDSGNSVAKVVHSFGREDQLDREALSRLVASIGRYLGPEAQLRLMADAAEDTTGELAFVSCRQLGGTWVLDGLWRRLGIDELIKKLLGGRRCDPVQVERVLFALVANRALDPCSKLAATRWAGELAHVPGLETIDDDACYRAMDVLLEIEDELAQQVFWQVATLLDLAVDLVFFDSTSTYWHRDTADDPVARDHRGEPVADDSPEAVDLGGFRTWGHFERPPRRSTANRDRDGGHPGRDPDPHLVLAGQHRRRHHDRTSPGRSAGLEAHPDAVGHRPRLRLREQPADPAHRRRSLHPGREATTRHQ